MYVYIWAICSVPYNTTIINQVKSNTLYLKQHADLMDFAVLPSDWQHDWSRGKLCIIFFNYATGPLGENVKGTVITTE